ncbi:MAG TPA: hypothetical protein IAB05_03075 [Candidatus Stercoripulliclostridium merdigallinarum]|uniref:Stage III sporulation protein AD n=1 Tax=Candidatus Stercoripulliclostridium merdigallinarum TaxID=2840951 RepID=A0A9D1MHS6_9FIRM|nr:hypothetical protein [Candidatus Stercoripulliclostridium merdigallinarum]
MTIVKVIAIAFVGLLAVGVLREIKPSLAAVAGIVTGLAIVYSLLDEFTYIVQSFKELTLIAEIDDALVKTIVKIIGIGYLTEFSAGIAEDYGSQSIAKKIEFGGKICIAVLALPVITGMISTIGNLL